MNKQTILKSTLCLLMAWVCNVTWAQAVIFPQETQPGTAKVNVDEANGVYSLSNDLFTANFKKADGKLTFGGCEALGLIAGSEIFKVQLGNGTEIPASAFTLVGDVVTERLTGKSKEVKASRRYHGQQIKATFTHESGLTIEWRAVLRDGSHYLRTEMDIKNPGTEGIAMNSIYPMLYTVQNVDGEKAPAVVGNTRGAVIASDKIFAGVETPTAYNVAGEATDLDNFAFKNWIGATSFAWTPEVDDIPQGIKNLNEYGVGAVVGSRGYVIFREAGNTTITLTYTGSNDAGNCKLHILGVDIVSLTGTVLNGDYHYGTTGGLHSGNSYTVGIPEAGAYMVRYFISVKDEPIASKGNITYGFKVAQPELVYDLASTETPYYTSSNDKNNNNDNAEATATVHLARSAAARASGTPTYKLTTTKLNSATLNAKTEATYIAIKNLATGNPGYFKGNGSIATPSSDDVIFIWEPKADAEGKFYLKKLNGTYMQNTAPKDFGTIDNAAVFTTTNPTLSAGENAGSLYFNGDAAASSYIENSDDPNLVRFVKEGTTTTTWVNVQPMSNGTPTYNDGKGSYTIHYAYEVEVSPSAFDFGSGNAIFSNWANASWTAAQNVPQDILNMGYTATQVVSMEQEITVEEAGELAVTFTWKGGNHRLDLVGVDLVDAEGNVVSGKYNRQAINSSAPANYKVVAPAGTYTLRYFVETKTETVDSNGAISIVHTALPQLNAESTTANYKWDTRDNNWSAFTDWTGTLPEGVNNLGTAKYIDHYYTMGVGFVTVGFDYSESIAANHKINTLGVQLLDLEGNVVSEDFHNGTSGGNNNNTNATYKVVAPKEGVYILRSIVCRTSGDYNTAGDTNISFEAIKSITGELGQQEVWESNLPGYTNWNGTLPDGVTKQWTAQYRDTYYAVKAGKLSLTFDFKEGAGHNHALYVLGVQLIDLNGNVVSSHFKNGMSGTDTQVTYTVKALKDGVYIVRHIVDKGTNDGRLTGGDITLTLVETKILGTINEDETLADAWRAADWKTMPADEVPNRVNEAGCSDENARVIEQQITITAAGVLSVEFVYGGQDGGGNKLNLVGVDLLDADGQVAVDDYHAGETGENHVNNVYKLNVFSPGVYTIRYFANNQEAINNKGNITLKLKVDYTLHLIAPATTPLTGKWSRQTTLAAGETWNISAVVGVIAPGQARRSFLCYSERERAVPWRAVPAYISWYEININRNNAAPGHEHENFTEKQCLPILEEWKKQLYDVYGEAPYAFVWDDGWDTYGEWQFHSGFPNGFTNMDNIGRQMGAGQGAWLGPVGGYGTSGGYRRNYWNSTKTGGMQLSNPLYYEVFVNAVTGLLRDKGYDFRFFKFDGISAQFSAVGPDAGATGNENAEAIIMAEKVLRGIKEDVFLNTTVGTWASPFWFQHTDAIWRQEKDDGTIGNNSNNRENWITYRDRLVYQNYVQNSPLCPINTLMTHGFILTEFGGPAGFSRDWKSVLNELRCAFACGSGMVELYNDYKLTNELANPKGEKGALWGEIANCMKWQRKNADVLPDIHWVGGNPWTGAKAEVYGWAAWNGPKAVLTLRNGADNAQEYKFTLREALDIPAYVKTSIVLTKAFEDQLALTGLTEGEAINIDTELTVTLPGSSVYIFDGAHQVVEGSEDTTPAVTISAVIGEYEVGTFYANEAVTIPEGVTAYVANQTPVADIEEADGTTTYTITMTKIEDGIIPAKTGVVIRGEMGTYNFTTTTSEGKTDTEGNLLKGYAGGADYEKVTVTEGDVHTNYVLNVKEKVVGFYKKAESFKVYNHRAYLQVPTDNASNTAASAPVLRIRYAGETTEIEGSELKAQGSQLIFDLQGRRVENPTKGIYIVNGKKVIVK